MNDSTPCDTFYTDLPFGLSCTINSLWKITMLVAHVTHFTIMCTHFIEISKWNMKDARSRPITSSESAQRALSMNCVIEIWVIPNCRSVLTGSLVYSLPYCTELEIWSLKAWTIWTCAWHGGHKIPGLCQFDGLPFLNPPLEKCSRIARIWMLTPQITNIVYKASWILLYNATKKGQQKKKRV